MGVYEKYVVPRIVDLTLRAEIVTEERKQCLAAVRGSVLEVGFGSGLNLPHYPEGVERVVAVDPSAEAAKMARQRIAAAPFPVEHVGLSGETIDAPDASFDAVVSTWTLCTIPGVETALGQMRRVLKPGGHLYFVEHGLAADPKVQRWQHRLNPIQVFLCGGCNVNRNIEALVTGAGFRLEKLDKGYARGPKFASFQYRGVAAPG
jgi:ubiquinone/menaquinone biosynthesis C-methylase UbiE